MCVLPQKHKCFRGPRGFLYLGASRAVSEMRMSDAHKAPPRGHGVPKNACRFWGERSDLILHYYEIRVIIL